MAHPVKSHLALLRKLYEDTFAGFPMGRSPGRDEDDTALGQSDIAVRMARSTAGLRTAVRQLETEISLREQLETELHEGRARLEAILDTAVEAIITIDQEGLVESLNPAAERLFGYQSDEVLGRNIGMLMPSPYRENHDEYIAAYLRTGERKIIGIGREVVGRRKNGESFPMHLSISEVWLGSRRIFTGFVHDMTERKRFETDLESHIESLKTAQDLTARQADDLRRQAEELGDQNAELEQFAYVASHDLQEPLRVVRGYTQLLSKRYGQQLDQEANDFLRYADDAADRMQQLITDLLSYSRVGRKKQLDPVDCEVSMKGSLANLQSAIRESNAALRCSPLPQVLGDGIQLSQLFQNLIANAITYRGPDPLQIEVAAERDGAQWRFSVRDNGIGIAPEFHDRIFGMFQRLHARTEYAGTGIGLAICRKIVEQHGGELWVESQPGQGATFFFTLQAVGGNSNESAAKQAD